MASAAGEHPEYYLVAFIQGHGLTIDPPGVQTRADSTDYGSGENSINMTVLSIPGDQYVSGMMGPMNNPPEDKTHWLGKSTELVIPGTLRNAFMHKCDKLDNIKDAFREGTEQIKTVYASANLKFPGGGFTVHVNPPEQQWWSLKGNPGEKCRKTPGQLNKRAASDGFQVMPDGAYGVFGICTNHPVLKDLCLTSITDEAVAQETYSGENTTDFIASSFYPSRNMIGHDAAGNPLGANYWIRAIDQSETDPELREKAKAIITKACFDKKLYSQHFITVLQALGIRHAWLYNPTCRDLCAKIDPICDQPPSPLRHIIPDSYTTLGQQSQSSLSSQSPSRSPSMSPSRSPSPLPSPQSPAAGGGISWPGFLNPFSYFKGPAAANLPPSPRTRPRSRSRTPTPTPGPNALSEGGSRKLRKRTTVRRKKITRKTKKRAYKKKSQKRNRRK